MSTVIPAPPDTQISPQDESRPPVSAGPTSSLPLLLPDDPTSLPGPKEQRPRGLGKATALLSAATSLSRVLGLCREQAFAALLGAGYYGDAFIMAFRLPNLLRDLFAEGALSAAFQPAFMQRLKQGGREEAYRLANLVQTTLFILVGLLVLLGIVFAPQLVSTWAQGYAAVPGKAELTVLLTRIMMPFLLLISLAAVVMGMLNAEERFLLPALAPTLFNLAAIVGGAALWMGGARHNRVAAIGWAAATLCGGALQFAVQLPALRRTGYRFAPRLDLRLRDKGLRQVLVAMAPATIGLMATQVNIYISSSFASAEDGAVTWLNVAFRLLQLPIGVFGVAVGTVALARFSQSSAALVTTADSPAAPADIAAPAVLPSSLAPAPNASRHGEALSEVRDTLRRGLRIIALLTLPTLVGLLVLAEPIIAVIYQHGAFHLKDTLAAASALRYYAVGLFAYAAVKVVAPVFYALQLSRIPVIATSLAVAANVALNVTLYGRYGYRVLALGTSLAALCNLAVLLVVFQRRYGGLWRQDLLLALARITLASVIMGLVVSAVDRIFLQVLDKIATHKGTIATLCELILTIVTGGVVYASLCWLMGLEEIGVVIGVVRRKVKRRSGAQATPTPSR